MQISTQNYYHKARDAGLVRDEHFVLTVTEMRPPKEGPVISGELRYRSAADRASAPCKTAVAFIAVLGEMDRDEVLELRKKLTAKYPDHDFYAEAKHELALALLRSDEPRVVFSDATVMAAASAREALRGLELQNHDPAQRLGSTTPKQMAKLIESKVHNVFTTDNLEEGRSFTWAQLDKARSLNQNISRNPTEDGMSP